VSGDDANKLALRLSKLIVEAAQDAARGKGLIILNKLLRQSRSGERPGVEKLREPAALVSVFLRPDQFHIAQRSIDDFHVHPD